MIIPTAAPRPPPAPPLPSAPPPVSRTVVFSLRPGTCVPMQETVPAGLQVRGVFEVAGRGPEVDLVVSGPAGAILYSKSNIGAGSFGFTTEQAGEYVATFSSSRGGPALDTREVTFTVQVRGPGFTEPGPEQGLGTNLGTNQDTNLGTNPHTNGTSD